jgi:hypothetical protein
MPGLRDLLKKKDKIEKDAPPADASNLAVPEFKFMRTTTESEEIIQPPSDPEDHPEQSTLSPRKSRDKSKERKHHLPFRKSANADVTKDPTAVQEQSLPTRPKEERRFSARLNFHKHSTSRSPSADSSVLPQDLPDAPEAVGPTGLDGGDKNEQREANQQREAQWEKRATILAQSNPLLEQEKARQAEEAAEKERQSQGRNKKGRSRSPSISDKRGDDDIQEAIRLHEMGELKLSTDMFGRLADPGGANNALAQVLYGLAVRHGWVSITITIYSGHGDDRS